MQPSIKEKRDDITRRFESVAEQHEAAATRQRNLAESLRQHTYEYVSTGITVFPTALREAMATYQKPKSYIRGLCTELKRPYIHAEEHEWRGHKVIELQIARSDRLSDCVAGFILVAKVMPQEPNYWNEYDEPVMRCDTGGTWRVWFNGKDGHEIFDHFVNKVRTDPVTRIVLKLS